MFGRAKNLKRKKPNTVVHLNIHIIFIIYKRNFGAESQKSDGDVTWQTAKQFKSLHRPCTTRHVVVNPRILPVL